MKIAILGATSQIARDFVAEACFRCPEWTLFLYARSKEKLISQNAGIKNQENLKFFTVSGFSTLEKFDLLINFVGVVSTSLYRKQGESIFDISNRFDNLALNYLSAHPSCRYFFLSSGAVYGSSFEKPVSLSSDAEFCVNGLTPSDWYGISKLHAEAKHRERQDKSILDIRVFSYFSRTQNPDTQFLLSSVVSSLRKKETFTTSSQNFFRDFITPEDFFQFVQKAVQNFHGNGALDVFSRAPVDKLHLLRRLSERFSLDLVIQNNQAEWSASKPHYYSTNKTATEGIGFKPQFSSLEGIEKEMCHLLSG